MPVRALTDAASVYGAARFIANAYDESSPRGMSYRSRDYDETLYYELMNNLSLYDELVYDDSSIENETSEEFKALFNKINDVFGETVMAVQTLDVKSYWDGELIKRGLCQLLHDLVDGDPTKLARLEAVQVPWAYHSSTHVDFPGFEQRLTEAGIEQLVPFAVFAWRGLCYSAVAEARRRQREESFAYVAAPGRIRALQAILSADEMRDFRYPRETWGKLSQQIDELPAHGLDFRNITSIAPAFTSNLTQALRNMPPENHLAFIAEHRNSASSKNKREMWGELLFNKRQNCTVGNQTIQIMNNVRAFEVKQIIATAAE